ncbi:HAD-IA family hydrolase [Nereida sp. MMG025]|uniref:HAD-IA family hydrolase n=1 Tax=Nereida sp. MMG025 TaxID=2909981 RepID=UPI001F013A59|nr:HAD-IA family hydrolase [Nereida sp. MMG025]MCF6444062.1 HAD-IA family hydrolase [Nereida sp. MMG025]
MTATLAPKAVLFGAIGTLTETSDVQRRAFNAAFADAGLDWHWDADSYVNMLRAPGGRDRIERFAASRGETVNAAALHAAKVDHFERIVDAEGILPRKGVCALIELAKSQGVALGFATTTNRDTVNLIFSGLHQFLHRSDFAFIGHADMVARGKPAPDIYQKALKDMNLRAQEAIAIEDTPESAQASVAAGIKTYGFAGQAAHGRSFPSGVIEIDQLSAQMLDARQSAA